MEPRRPRGYGGIDHETIGSDILAVPDTLRHLASQGRLGPKGVLDRVLSGTAMERLAVIEPDGWYPIEWLLEMTDTLASRIGASALRRVGRTLFQLSHAEHAATVLHCGLDVVRGIDGMYRHANRGTAIGGWEVLSTSGGIATLDKTTPHHCALEEGILSEALTTVGCRAVVLQESCFREGAPSCRFVIEQLEGPWEPEAPHRGAAGHRH